MTNKKPYIGLCGGRQSNFVAVTHSALSPAVHKKIKIVNVNGEEGLLHVLAWFIEEQPAIIIFLSRNHSWTWTGT